MKLLHHFLMLTIAITYWSSRKEVDGFAPMSKTSRIHHFTPAISSTKIAYKTKPYFGVASNDTLSMDASMIPQVPRSVEHKSTKTKGHILGGLDPAEVEIVPYCHIESGQEQQVDDQDECALLPEADFPFVDMLRSSSSYIVNHRDTVVVCHIPGELLEWSGFPELMEDISLMWLLGMKIVLVVGCRSQVEDRLLKQQTQSKSDHNIDDELLNGIRVTNEEIMRIVEEESGYVRFEVERQLHRCLKLQGAETNEPGALNGNVVSGTFFEAKPIGFVDGVDHGLSGYPSRAYSSKILSIVEDNRNIALLTSCAIGRDGELYYVNSESVASYVASEIGATKLIFCSNHGLMLRDKESKQPLQNFRLQDASAILDHFSVQMDPTLFGPSRLKTKSTNEALTPDQRKMLLKIGLASLALQNGVQRAHIVSPSDGALLTELFTAQEGTGTCIIQDDRDEKIHPDEYFFGDLERHMNLFDDIYPIHEFPNLDINQKVQTKNGLQTSFLF